MRALVLLAVPLFISACGSSHEDRDSSGPKGSRSFALDGFERVKLKGSDDVVVKAGPVFSVSATGPQKMLDELDVIVANGTLIVSRKSLDGFNWHWSSNGGVVVTVTMPLIRGADLSGSGDLSIESTADDVFEATLGGSGDLNVTKIKAAKSRFSLMGSGDIKADGTAQDLTIDLAGSGDVDAKSLTAETLKVSLIGSGDIGATASGDATISLVGSGDVQISGAKNCKTTKVGSGTVNCQ